VTGLLAPVFGALQPVLGVPTIDRLVFAVCAVIVLTGAVGVVLSSNPVYAALSLVLTLFGVAVLFVEEDAQFLAAVQVVVYAGAIVVLFLFVIMLLGVDRRESVRAEKLPGQRPLAFLLGLAALGELLALTKLTHWATGARSVAGPASGGGANTAALARSIFTTYLLPFELTSLLLIIAVIAAVVLARRPGPTIERPEDDEGDEPDPAMLPARTGDVAPGGRNVDPETVKPGSR
jgi:NADH-quinone oxidoreductase subunit J